MLANKFKFKGGGGSEVSKIITRGDESFYKNERLANRGHSEKRGMPDFLTTLGTKLILVKLDLIDSLIHLFLFLSLITISLQ